MFDDRPQTKAVRRTGGSNMMSNNEFDEADNAPNFDLDDF